MLRTGTAAPQCCEPDGSASVLRRSRVPIASIAELMGLVLGSTRDINDLVGNALGLRELLLGLRGEVNNGVRCSINARGNLVFRRVREGLRDVLNFVEGLLSFIGTP